MLGETDTKTFSGTAAEFTHYAQTIYSGIEALKGNIKASADFIGDCFSNVSSVAGRVGGALGASMGSFSYFAPSINLWERTFQASFGEATNLLEGREPNPNAPFVPIMDDFGEKMFFGQAGQNVQKFLREGD